MRWYKYLALSFVLTQTIGGSFPISSPFHALPLSLTQLPNINPKPLCRHTSFKSCAFLCLPSLSFVPPRFVSLLNPSPLNRGISQFPDNFTCLPMRPRAALST